MKSTFAVFLRGLGVTVVQSTLGEGERCVGLAWDGEKGRMRPCGTTREVSTIRPYRAANAKQETQEGAVVLLHNGVQLPRMSLLFFYRLPGFHFYSIRCVQLPLVPCQGGNGEWKRKSGWQ